MNSWGGPCTGTGDDGAVMGRTRLALDRSLTLGTVAERLAAVYGDRVLVDEDGWTVTHVEAADLVERWSAAPGAAPRAW